MQNFRLAFDEFATEVERLDEEMAEYFQYITASNQDGQEKRTVVGTELSQAEIETVQMVEPRPESGWDALVEGFMDSWLGESITSVSTAANPFLSQALIYKTAIDMKCRNMTLEESLAETGEFAKGYVQSVPKVAGEMVQGLLELPPAIMELPDTIYEVYKLINEYGIKAVADGILESTEESIKRVWNEEVVHGTARSRGEVTGRAVITVAELALSVKGLADWLSKGKKVASQTDEIIAGVEKVEDVIDETGDVSTDVRQAAKVMDEIQDTVDDVKTVENGQSGIDFESGTTTSLRDLMTPEEIARYDAYWNNVADDMLKSNINSYRQAILNGDITKPTGGKINSKVVTAAIDTNTGDIYYGISGMNNNPTRNVINPQMQAILDSVDGTMTNYPLENCGEFNAINNALNNGVDINALRVYSVDRVGGNYKAPCINCQNLYGNIVHFTE